MTGIALFHHTRQGGESALGVRSACERSARAAQRLAALGEMTGGIAHDFRNVLAVIESGLRIVERSADEPERMRVAIAAAREGIERGTKLTAQLLGFAKQQDFGVESEDANELLRRLSLFLRYGAGPGIQVQFKLASDILECGIDRSQFGTALLNLVINARDAMPDGGKIQISTARLTVEAGSASPPEPGTYVRVRVSDNGQGMSEDVMRKIFDRFFTTKGENGTGLGLPQVHAFMRQMGGYVNVMSEPGTGTIVDLLFPAVNADGVVTAPAER